MGRWAIRMVAVMAAVIMIGCETTPQEPLVLELSPYFSRLRTLDANLGEKTTPMIFDTGASITIVTPENLQALRCEPYGRLVGHRMHGERVDFERCGFRAINFGDVQSSTEVYTFDLMALLPEELPEVGGVVSLASFADRPFTLDLAGKELIIETAQSLRARIAGAREADLRIVRGVAGPSEVSAFVRIEAPTGDLWFLLDSANLDHVIIAPHTINQLNGESESDSSVDLGNVLDLDLEIAGAYPVSTPVRVGDILYDGALNEEVMRRFLITFDLKNERVWFSKSNVSAITP